VLDTIIELNVQQVLYGSYVDNLTLLITNSLMTQRDLKQEDLASKLVCFGVDGVSTFQGLKSRVIV
jgi:hypothetical protein